MTHEQRLQAKRVYEAAMEFIGRRRCDFCENLEFKGRGEISPNPNLTSILFRHEAQCPYRIVIEAALANTESEGA